jgi:hypothetical protein
MHEKLGVKDNLASAIELFEILMRILMPRSPRAKAPPSASHPLSS